MSRAQSTLHDPLIGSVTFAAAVPSSFLFFDSLQSVWIRRDVWSAEPRSFYDKSINTTYLSLFYFSCPTPTLVASLFLLFCPVSSTLSCAFIFCLSVPLNTFYSSLNPLAVLHSLLPAVSLSYLITNHPSFSVFLAMSVALSLLSYPLFKYYFHPSGHFSAYFWISLLPRCPPSSLSSFLPFSPLFSLCSIPDPVSSYSIASSNIALDFHYSPLYRFCIKFYITCRAIVLKASLAKSAYVGQNKISYCTFRAVCISTAYRKVH